MCRYRRHSPLLLLSLVLLLLQAVSPLKADIVTFHFTGEVTLFADEQSISDGSLHVGSQLNGSYTFETGVPDGESDDPAAGYYHFTQADTGVQATLGNYALHTDALETPFDITVYNNFFGTWDDYLLNVSLSHPPSVGGGLVLGWSTLFLLEDSTGRGLSSDSLPLQAPDLTQFDTHNFDISFEDPQTYEMVHCDGVITSLTLAPASQTPDSRVCAGTGFVCRTARLRTPQRLPGACPQIRPASPLAWSGTSASTGSLRLWTDPTALSIHGALSKTSTGADGTGRRDRPGPLTFVFTLTAVSQRVPPDAKPAGPYSRVMRKAASARNSSGFREA